MVIKIVVVKNNTEPVRKNIPPTNNCIRNSKGNTRYMISQDSALLQAEATPDAYNTCNLSAVTYVIYNYDYRNNEPVLTKPRM